MAAPVITCRRVSVWASAVEFFLSLIMSPPESYVQPSLDEGTEAKYAPDNIVLERAYRSSIGRFVHDLRVRKGLLEVAVWLENHTIMGIVEDHCKSPEHFRTYLPHVIWIARAASGCWSVQPKRSEL